MKKKHILYFVIDIAIIAVFIGLYALFHHFDNGQYNSLYPSLLVSGFILLLFICVIEGISLTFDKNATLNTLFISIGILGMILLDHDSFAFYFSIGMQEDKTLLMWLNNIQYSLFLFTTIFLARYFERDYKIEIDKKEKIFSFIALTIFLVAYCITNKFGYSYIITIITVLFTIYQMMKIYWSMKEDKKSKYFYFSIKIYFFIDFILVSNTLQYHFPSFYALGFNSLSYILIGVLFILIYLTFVIENTRAVKQKEELERKVNELRTNILLHQMSPHFVFNTLNKIKTQYSLSIDKGNNTLDLFAKELRALIDSNKNNIVSINQELDLVNNYVEIINTDLEHPYEVIFDIENSNAYVPCFSIQTLVENAIKYSGVNNSDGYITIKSFKEGNENVIVVEDNGVGFDVNKMKEGQGLTNTQERLQLLLDGTLEIVSSPKGTIITMRIPLKEKESL